MRTLISTDTATGKTKTFPVENKVCGTPDCTGRKDGGECCQGGKCKCSDPKTVSPDDKEKHSQR